MKIYFLNLPSKIPVVRRYMCSSFPPNILFPPHEMLSLCAMGKKTGHEVKFTDATAEKLTNKDVFELIEDFAPDLIISILSFELFDKDVDSIAAIKEKFQKTKYGIFGHYPTHFAKESLQLSKADFVMRGEPDEVLKNLLNNWKSGFPSHIKGVVYYNENNELIDNGEDNRVLNPNILPMPSYELLENKYYGEPLMSMPFGLIQTARGCPFQCNYCVHSFGTKLTMLSPENVLKHILYLKEVHQIKSLRFIDDTFTAIPSRVISICKLMVEKKVNLKWTCLSRADTLNEEMLIWMKKAGCVRVNIGIESGSQKVLDFLNKKIDIKSCVENLKIAKKIGIEVMGFFLTGVPTETDQDIEESIKFAKETCDFILVDFLKVYPGTPLFNKLENQIDFSLYPYNNVFKSDEHNIVAAKRRSYFYRRFYFSKSFVINGPKKLIPHIAHAKNAIDYIFTRATTNYTY